MSQNTATNKLKKKERSVPPPVFRKQKLLSGFLMISTALLLFYPPFFRGLFLNQQMFMMHILTALVFILFWAIKFYQKDYEFISTPLDWALLAYTGAVLLSIFGAVHFGEAVYGFLRVLNYFMLYWLVSRLVDSWARYRLILQVLVGAGLGVAVVGILAATGLYEYPGAFDGRVILSTMQYPNSTAAYLAASTLLSLALWATEKNIFVKLIYSLVSFLLILVILCTLSKGAWVILVTGALLLLVGIKGLFNKTGLLYEILAVSGAAFLVYNYFLPSVAGNPNASGLKYILGGILLVVLVRLLWLLFENCYARSKGLSVVAFLILITGGFWFLLKNRLTGILISNDFLMELAGLTDFGGSSFVSRLDMSRWGMAIVKDYPINGTGVGGWNALYHQYQDYLLWSAEVHNHFVQVWVESGTIGFLAFCVIWIVLAYGVYKLHRYYRMASGLEDTAQAHHEVFLFWGVFASAVALGLHATIDFDLSIGAIAIFLWTLFALINAACRLMLPAEQRYYIKKAPVNIVLAGILAVSLLWTGCSYFGAGHYNQEAAKNIKSLDTMQDSELSSLYLTEGIRLYEKACALDGNNADYHASLAWSKAIGYQGMQSINHPDAAAIRSQIIMHIEKAEKLKPYDVKVRNSLLYTCLNIGDVNGAVRQGEELIKANPNDIKAYSAYATVLWAGIDYWDKQKREDEAQKLLKKVVEIPSLIEKQAKRINPERPWNGAPLQLPEETLALVAKAEQRQL